MRFIETARSSFMEIIKQPAQGEVVPDLSHRKRCPYYGFLGKLLESGFLLSDAQEDGAGNCCGFMGGQVPCQMEALSKSADWDQCHYNTPQLKDKQATLFAEGAAFPLELLPAGADNWEGIPLSTWYRLVMGREA